MEFTQAITDELVGGQLEIQDGEEGCVYRGEINGMKLESEGGSRKLVVDFSWLAKMGPDCWEAVEPKPCEISLLIYSAFCSPVGQYVLTRAAFDTYYVIYPPDDHNLDPAEVRGLVLN